jgi:hypothetical protein
VKVADDLVPLSGDKETTLGDCENARAEEKSSGVKILRIIDNLSACRWLVRPEPKDSSRVANNPMLIADEIERVAFYPNEGIDFSCRRGLFRRL